MRRIRTGFTLGAVLAGCILSGAPVQAAAEPAPVATSATWWQPTSDQPISWHWQLSQTFRVPRDVRPGVFVYDVDGELTSRATIQRLRDWGTEQGHDVVAICYIDVGVFETYRSDAPAFRAARDELRRRTGNPDARLWGNKDKGWNDSYWLDVRKRDLLRPIMEARIRDWCAAKGFDAVEPDETEVWDNRPGFSISKAQNHRYTRMIARIAHDYDLSVGLKGNNGEASELADVHDWALSEECFAYSECGQLRRAFAEQGKAVFVVEYDQAPDCGYANQHHLNAVRRDLDLVRPGNEDYRYRPCRADGVASW